MLRLAARVAVVAVVMMTLAMGSTAVGQPFGSVELSLLTIVGAIAVVTWHRRARRGGGS